MTEKKRILLIDNEEGLCRMMEQILLDSGYLARACTSPRIAVDEFRPGAWDLVITDIKMPGMTGIEVLQAIKERQKDIPVIMITAYATVETSIQALRRGAYDMLTKPFEPEELLYELVRFFTPKRLAGQQVVQLHLVRLQRGQFGQVALHRAGRQQAVVGGGRAGALVLEAVGVARQLVPAAHVAGKIQGGDGCGLVPGGSCRARRH